MTKRAELRRLAAGGRLTEAQARRFVELVLDATGDVRCWLLDRLTEQLAPDVASAVRLGGVRICIRVRYSPDGRTRTVSAVGQGWSRPLYETVSRSIGAHAPRTRVIADSAAALGWDVDVGR